MMMETRQVELDRVDLVIELSLLKLRRLSVQPERRDRERMLILQTLKRAVYRKHCLLTGSTAADTSKLCATTEDDQEVDVTTSADMERILQDSIQRMGLSRSLNLHVIHDDNHKDHDDDDGDGGCEVEEEHQATEPMTEEEVPAIRFPPSSKRTNQRHQSPSCVQSAQGVIPAPPAVEANGPHSRIASYCRDMIDQYFSP